MNITRQVMLDIAYAELAGAIKKIEQDKGLTAIDMENVLYKLLNDIKTDKETQYSADIVNLIYRAQQLEKEVNNDKPNDQS